MTRLNNKQTAALRNAVSRAGGNVLPLPEDMCLKGGGLAAMLKALERRGFVQHSDDADWHITEEGRAAVIKDTEGNKSAGENASVINEPETSALEATPLFRPGTRQAQLLELLQRDAGADIDEMAHLTGWQAHSVRAVLTGFRKRGVDVTRAKEGNGVSVYRASVPINTADAVG